MKRLAVCALALMAIAAAKHPAPPASPSPVATPGTGFHSLSLTSGGSVVATLDLNLEVKGEPVKPAAGTRTRLSWHEEQGVMVGRSSGPAWEATLRLTPQEGGALSLDVDLHYLADVVSGKEAVRLRLPGNAHAIARDLTWKPVDGDARVDRGTPILVASRVLAVSGGEGLVAARYQPGERKGGPYVDVELILDDQPSHPFSTYDQCLDKLPTGGDESDPNAPVDWTELEKNKTPRSHLTRVAGSEVHARAEILVPSAEVMPLIVERWPSGAKAAFVVTDHADRTDPKALRALLYGSSDEKAAGYGTKGFFGHGLAITKTFFAGNHLGTLEGDAQARTLADAILAAGSEVASHSITSVADPRERVKNNLSVFDPWKVVTWTDHEPYTNCEALSAQGWKKEAPFGISDLLVDHGYRWVWAATDLASAKDSALTNLFGGAASAAEPPIFPFPPEPRLMTFRTVWFYSTPAAMAKAIDDPALAALEKARGLFVGHTYLSASLATTRSDEHKANLVVKKAKGGALSLDDKFDQALGRLEQHVKAGTLASLTWLAAGDRLLALGAVEVHYRADGSAVVENRTSNDLRGLTVSVPAPDATLAIAGASASEARHDDRTTLWFDLPAGKTATLTASRGGQPAPFAEPLRVTLTGR